MVEQQTSVVRRLWEALFAPDRTPPDLPRGISLVAARHRVTVPTFRLLAATETGRDRVHHDDWSLLRTSAGYYRRRTAMFMEVLTAASRDVSASWLVWKAGALLFTVPDYPLLCEAADVDIIVSEAGIEEWAGFLSARSGTITKSRHTPEGTLRAFQARQLVEQDVQLVWDVKASADLPARTVADGVPVAATEDHLDLMHDHAMSHAHEADGCRLRMFYDAALAGASWAGSACEKHVLSLAPAGV